MFHGEVIGLRDVIAFQGITVDEVKEAFRESIDDYLAFCAERGEEPRKPLTGKFVVRIPPDLHRKVYVAAKKSGSSLNSRILQTLEHSTEHLSYRGTSVCSVFAWLAISRSLNHQYRFSPFMKGLI
ncbi:MAG: type II toxin-antitoxin system HicB family antitoxin [Proteobacteria bacterium]|nr:type II toxin-antitoxin system HicB family antitoxin [Pseudomonadota bacterium]MBU1965848.1 type II toxin-antitoxin system HicB family antitoxin [Pseudomonadota bacterium]